MSARSVRVELTRSLRNGRRAITGAVALLCVATSATSSVAAEPVREPGSFFVIINSNNPIRELSRDQVAAYFLRRHATWPNGSGVHPVDLPPGSQARSAFSRDVLRRAPSDVSAYWIQEIFAGRSEPPEVKNTDAAVLSYVAATPGAIGYVSTVHSTSTVRVLAILP